MTDSRVLMTDIVEDVAEALRTVAEHRGISLSMEADPDLYVCGDAIAVKEILVHLVLIARDVLLDGGAIRFTARRRVVDPAQDAFPDAAGEYVALRVDAGPSPVADQIKGVNVCRERVAELHGYLEVIVDEDAALSLTAFIPMAPVQEEPRADRGSAVVLHDDPRVRRTLTSALADLGCPSEEGSAAVADAVSLEDVVIVFVDGATARRLRASESQPLIVEVVARGETTTGPGPVLTVPFELGELEALLERALEKRT